MYLCGLIATKGILLHPPLPCKVKIKLFWQLWVGEGQRYMGESAMPPRRMAG